MSDYDVPKANNHKIGCRCKACWCPKHSLSLRRPTKPPHKWMYETCPLCKKGEPFPMSDVAAPC